jgi:hypothetical protein
MALLHTVKMGYILSQQVQTHEECKMETQEQLALRRALQISLLNCVTPYLRQVNIVVEENHVVLNFYYDHLDQEQQELPDEVEAEMWGFYGERKEISTNIIISQFPKPMPNEGLCVYLRYGENNQAFPTIIENLENKTNMPLLTSYCTQVSLLGYVTPNLRKIFLEESHKQLSLHFYYHELTEIEKGIPALIAERMKKFLNLLQIQTHVTVLPYPSRMPEGSAIYARYEKITAN